MTLYKLTDQQMMTRGNTLWGEGVTHIAKFDGDGPLCSEAWIHAYEHPLIAVLRNPKDAKINNPLLWIAEGEIGKKENQLKCGCKSLTTIKQIPLPKISLEQKVRFAIGCAWPPYINNKWRAWAENWLDNKDRTYKSAADAAHAATYTATYAAAAADAAAYAAAAADAAAYAVAATYAAAYAADAAHAADAAVAAADAAAYAADAAAAAYAADAAHVDFIAIAEWAITDNSISHLYPEK